MLLLAVVAILDSDDQTDDVISLNANEKPVSPSFYSGRDPFPVYLYIECLTAVKSPVVTGEGESDIHSIRSALRNQCANSHGVPPRKMQMSIYKKIPDGVVRYPE